MNHSHLTVLTAPNEISVDPFLFPCRDVTDQPRKDRVHDVLILVPHDLLTIDLDEETVHTTLLQERPLL
jgi:hypothetical protein